MNEEKQGRDQPRHSGSTDRTDRAPGTQRRHQRAEDDEPIARGHAPDRRLGVRRVNMAQAPDHDDGGSARLESMRTDESSGQRPC